MTFTLHVPCLTVASVSGTLFLRPSHSEIRTTIHDRFNEYSSDSGLLPSTNDRHTSCAHHEDARSVYLKGLALVKLFIVATVKNLFHFCTANWLTHGRIPRSNHDASFHFPHCGRFERSIYTRIFGKKGKCIHCYI